MDNAFTLAITFSVALRLRVMPVSPSDQNIDAFHTELAQRTRLLD